jgi:cytochrome c biogenesis protein CcmG, thiol:disulfide interchange protein DsbE
MRRLVVALLSVGLAAVLVIGLTQAGSKTDDSAAKAPKFDVKAATAQLADAEPAIAPLYKQPSAILDGGVDAFERRISSLRGNPVVVNKWASWCHPCRAEFPIFQQVATTYGSDTAFVGINGKDKRPAAERFLAAQPLPYPSYEDPDEEIASERKVSTYYPMTLFIDENGKTVGKHAGEYTSVAQLKSDIDKYLG